MNLTESLFSTVPVKRTIGDDGKKKYKPYVRWKPYQYKRPTEDEINLWDQKYPDHLTGIITGEISGVIGLDFDTREVMEAFINQFPELKDTAQYPTSRGGHYYVSHIDKFNYSNIHRNLLLKPNFNGEDFEVKGNGGLMIARPWIIQPTQIIIPPDGLVRMIWEEINRPSKEIEQQSNQPRKISKTKKYTPYNGTAKCIQYILKRELVEGERYMGLFVLYNLLMKHNPTATARYIVHSKNKALQKPLDQEEINHIFEEDENHYFDFNCEGVVMKLSYISGVCGQCPNLDLKGNKLLNKKTIDRLSNDEFIALQYARFGYSQGKTSIRMNKSKSTVSNYLTNARKKLGIEPTTKKTERLK